MSTPGQPSAGSEAGRELQVAAEGSGSGPTPCDLAEARIPLHMGRVRYAFRFVGEFGSFVVINRAWWTVPLFLFMAAATILVIVGQVVAPITLYSLF
jgi:hypothetical protein